jgi:glycosyltransferase involved in cell wall biosynthesis
MNTPQPDGAVGLAATCGTTITRSVWMITARFHPVIGGAERQCQQVSEDLVASGCRVTVVTRRQGPGLPSTLPSRQRMGGVDIVRVLSYGPGRVGSILFIVNALLYLARHGRSGIYHAHDTGAAAWIAVLAGYVYRGRSLIKLRTGRLGYERRLGGRLSRWNLLAVLGLADRILVVNREVSRFLRSRDISSERVEFVPNGIDTCKYAVPSFQEKIAARQRCRLPLDKCLVLWVGRLEWVKGIDVLLKAWSTLRPGIRARSQLLIVGEGSATAPLRELARSLDLLHTVRFEPPPDDIRYFYWSADVFVLPSRSEGMSNALLESMATGLPAVASRVGGAPDMITSGENGYLFETQNAQDLANRLEQVLSERRGWSDMGIRAREAVVQKGDIRTTISALLSIYAELT